MWRKTTTRLGDVSTRLERSVIEEKDDFILHYFTPSNIVLSLLFYS